MTHFQTRGTGLAPGEPKPRKPNKTEGSYRFLLRALLSKEHALLRHTPVMSYWYLTKKSWPVAISGTGQFTMRLWSGRIHAVLIRF
jgi:hypothetical protein